MILVLNNMRRYYQTPLLPSTKTPPRRYVLHSMRKQQHLRDQGNVQTSRVNSWRVRPCIAEFKVIFKLGSSVKADSLFSYQPPINLIAVCIMLPASYILTPRWFHKVCSQRSDIGDIGLTSTRLMFLWSGMSGCCCPDLCMSNLIWTGLPASRYCWRLLFMNARLNFTVRQGSPRPSLSPLKRYMIRYQKSWSG